ncbi:MAG: ATP-binding protein [Chitinophagaceae bacterium]|nr:ATP-binding protein [Chitinophagaceae bacterium]
MPWIPRHISARLNAAMKSSPVVFLNGARQSGKSTLVKQFVQPSGKKHTPRAAYVTFDKPGYIASATAAPEEFLENFGLPLIIDEVQMVPQLFKALKLIIDEKRFQQHKKINGSYLLTGSANILALPQLAESLVGRMSVLTLYPFSTAEAIEAKGDGLERILKKDFFQLTNPKKLSITRAIQLATFPEIHSKKKDERSTWLDGYITTLLQRDVKLLADIDKIYLLPQLLRILCNRAGGLLNDSDIGREAGLNSVTTKNYRKLLQHMFLITEVKPWHKNGGKRLIKAPKGYIIDTSLLCHMMDWDVEVLAERNPKAFGHVVENYVATELIKQLSFSRPASQLYHFRTSDGKEVDFVIENPNGDVFAIEVKSSAQINDSDFKGIRELAGLIGKDFTGGIVLYNGKEVLPFGPKMWAVPLFVLWQ